MDKKKPGVGFGIIILNKEKKILLGKRHKDPKKADTVFRETETWTCPGGKLNYKEDLEEAAKVLKLTAPGLLKMGIVDEIVPEAEGGAHRGAEQSAQNLKSAINKNLDELSSLSVETLLDQRYQRYRKMGIVNEGG